MTQPSPTPPPTDDRQGHEEGQQRARPPHAQGNAPRRASPSLTSTDSAVDDAEVPRARHEPQAASDQPQAADTDHRRRSRRRGAFAAPARTRPPSPPCPSTAPPEPPTSRPSDRASSSRFTGDGSDAFLMATPPYMGRRPRQRASRPRVPHSASCRTAASLVVTSQLRQLAAGMPAPSTRHRHRRLRPLGCRQDHRPPRRRRRSRRQHRLRHPPGPPAPPRAQWGHITTAITGKPADGTARQMQNDAREYLTAVPHPPRRRRSPTPLHRRTPSSSAGCGTRNFPRFAIVLAGSDLIKRLAKGGPRHPHRRAHPAPRSQQRADAASSSAQPPRPRHRRRGPPPPHRPRLRGRLLAHLVRAHAHGHRRGSAHPGPLGHARPPKTPSTTAPGIPRLPRPPSHPSPPHPRPQTTRPADDRPTAAPGQCQPNQTTPTWHTPHARPPLAALTHPDELAAPPTRSATTPPATATPPGSTRAPANAPSASQPRPRPPRRHRRRRPSPPRAAGERHLLRALTHLIHGPVRHVIVDDAHPLTDRRPRSPPRDRPRRPRPALAPLRRRHPQHPPAHPPPRPARVARRRPTAPSPAPPPSSDMWRQRSPRSRHVRPAAAHAWWHQDPTAGRPWTEPCSLCRSPHTPTPPTAGQLLPRSRARRAMTAGHTTPSSVAARRIAPQSPQPPRHHCRTPMGHSAPPDATSSTPGSDALGHAHPDAQLVRLADVTPDGRSRPPRAQQRPQRHVGRRPPPASPRRGPATNKPPARRMRSSSDGTHGVFDRLSG